MHAWDDVETLFADAMELAPHQRDAVLASRCAGRPELRGEVESLLAAHDESVGFLQVNAAGQD